MIRLSLLGPVTLSDADGGEITAVVRQPKRLALLAYLAAAEPVRFHRRDSLLGLFWPEQDDAHGRAALRRALHFLRRALGDGAIRARGDELGIDPAAVWCDVAAFRDALDVSGPEDALALYRGELLEGFFVSSAPEFERWLDQERSRLRATAAAAAWSAAEQAEANGNGPKARDLARRAMALTPDDEAGVQRLIGLLDRLGDRASALQAYEEFARRLRQEYDLEPSPETRGVMDRVRARRAATALPMAQEPAPAPQSHVIAVLPFTVRGDLSLAYLREGIVDMLSVKLDGAGELRTVDAHALLGYVHELDAAPTEPAHAKSVVARFGAGAFILGSVVVAADRIRLHATLYDVAASREIRAEAEAVGEPGLFGAVDDLVRQLLAQRTTSAGSHLGRLAAATTDSVPALKAYLAGERALRFGQFTDAARAYERAVAEQPGFALGQFRLATARAACGMMDDARDAAALAAAARHRLGPHTRMLCEAQAAWLDGDVDQAEDLYRTILKDRSEDVDAWYGLGHLLFAWGGYRGLPVGAARRPLERALALDPKHAAALAELVSIAAVERRHGELESLAERFLLLSPSADQALVVRSIVAFALDDAEARRAVGATLARSRPAALIAALGQVALVARIGDTALEFAERVCELTAAGMLRAEPQLIAAYLACSQGDWRAGLRFVGVAQKLNPSAGLIHRAVLLAHADPESHGSEIAECSQALEAWEPASNRRDALHGGLLPQLRHYLVGTLAVRRGEAERAESCAVACDRLAGPAHAPRMPANLARGLRARAAVLRGEHEDALAVLGALELEGWIHQAPHSPFYSLAAERRLMADVLERLGRGAESEGWRAALGQRSPYELVFH